jgi:hypothetical protein
MTLTGPKIALAICLLAATIGCVRWKSDVSTPVANNVVLGQLVVLSDFPLPQKHRLLEELAAQRMAQSTKLALPVSDEPIYVYLFPTVDKFKAFVRSHYPGFPDRRAFFVESDTRLMVYAFWGDHVAEDLRHEVAHGYLHAVVRNLPLWLDEGLAEYFEVPRGTRGLNKPHVDDLKSSLARGWRPDLRRLEALQSVDQMTQLDYAESWAWVHYLSETSPERLEFLRSYLKRLGNEGAAEPLSLGLREKHPDYDRRLAEYIEWLGQNAGAPGLPEDSH